MFKFKPQDLGGKPSLSAKRMNDPTVNPKKELAYDLRQAVAEIIGEVLKQITIARLQRQYEMWMNLIDNFHTEVSMKLSDKEQDEYMTKWNETIEICLANNAVFQGFSKDTEGHSKVYGAIKELEMWIKKKADKHDIFGSKRNTEGLS